MKCGIYELDITPWLGLDIPGQFSKRVSIDILERLSAIASYFESVGEKVVIISTDSIIVPDEAVSVIKNNIAKKLDMKTSNVFICATHTHTGGPVENWGEFFKAKGEYIELYTARCIDAAVLAAKDAREVKLSFGIGKENTIANYRVRVLPDGSIQTNAPSGSGTKPYGEIDPDVSVLRIDNADGTLYGAIVNYACHCDCVCGSAPEASLKYSADYPGIMRATIKKTYGESFKPMFINGFCGNINHCDFENAAHTKQLYYYRSLGRRLAAMASHTLETAEPMKCEKLAGADKDMTLPTRLPSEENIKWAKTFDSTVNKSVSDAFYAVEYQRIADIGVEDVDLTVQVVRVGDLFLFGMPGEIFVEYGFALKERSPGKYNITANLSNGCVGYIPIPELFVEGVYEARRCSTSRLCHEAGNVMVEKLLKLAEEIK